MSINEYGGIFTDAIGRKGKNTSVEVFLPNYLDWRYYYLDDPPMPPPTAFRCHDKKLKSDVLLNKRTEDRGGSLTDMSAKRAL